MKLQESFSKTAENRTDVIATEGEILCGVNSICRKYMNEMKVKMDLINSEVENLKFLVLKRMRQFVHPLKIFLWT